MKTVPFHSVTPFPSLMNRETITETLLAVVHLAEGEGETGMEETDVLVVVEEVLL